MENAVIQTVKNVLPLVRKSTIHFSKSDLRKRTKEVTSVMSTNKPPLFKIPLEQKSDKEKVQVAALKTIVPYSPDYRLLVKVVKETPPKNSLNMRT